MPGSSLSLAINYNEFQGNIHLRGLEHHGSRVGSRGSLTIDQAAARLTESGLIWSTAPGQGTTVTYGFRTTAGSEAPVGFIPFTQAQITAAEAALQAWSDVANISFVRTQDPNSATILFGSYQDASDIASAFAYLPGSRDATALAGDIWVNMADPGNTSTGLSTSGTFVLIHEVGHALGLNHPGDYRFYGTLTPNRSTFAEYSEDTSLYSVMSYWDQRQPNGAYSAAPMLDDVAAIQRLYGVNMTTRTGDTVYGFNSNADQPWLRLDATGGNMICAIWDAGGVDTLDFSGISTNQTIDLRQGCYSFSTRVSVAIAVGARIENAIGGSGNDDINGNALGNRITPGTGNDKIDGGGGVDVVVLSGARSAYTLGGSDYSIYVTGPDGTKELYNVEYIQFSDQLLALTSTLNIRMHGDQDDNVLAGGTGDDELHGEGGNDTIEGLSGADSIQGGRGDDRLFGGAGNDHLSGDDGDDLIDGGDGFDFAVFGRQSDRTLTVDLATGTASGGFGNDTLRSIEGVIADTAFPILYGDDNANQLYNSGVGGRFYGRGGNDIIGGGNRSDGGGVPDLLKTADHANASIASAVDLDDYFDMSNNIDAELYGPTATVRAVSHGGVEYYAVTVTAGMQVIFDIDDGQFDSGLRLINAQGTILASNDDGPNPDSGRGWDSKLEYAFNIAGTYFIAVGGAGDATPAPRGLEYTLRVTAIGHAVVPEGFTGCYIDGGDGSDQIAGGQGDDVLIGGRGSDMIQGGGGIDRALYQGLYGGYARTGSVNNLKLVGGLEGGTDTVSGVETVQFLDGALSFQTDTWQSVVYRMYDAAFDRGPDPFGMVTWTDALAGGMNLSVLSDTFEASAEFQARYGALNNTNFIKEMYRFSLNREADAPGLAHWEGLMAGGMTRAEVLYHFSESIEHKNVMTTRILAEGMWIQDENTIAIARLYDSILDKLPDLAGLRAYRNQMTDGATLLQVAQSLMGQPEYQTVYGGLANQAFVEKIYQVILNRAGDTNGIASWTAQLDAGLSRAELLVNFSQSIEHAAAYQRTWNQQVRTLENGLYPAASPDHDGAVQAEILPVAHHDDGFTAEAPPGVAAHDKGGLVAEVSLPAEVLPGALDAVDAWNAHIVRTVGNTAAFDGLDGEVAAAVAAEITAEVLPAVGDDGGLTAEVLPGVVDDGVVAEVLPGAPNETVPAPFDRTGGVMLTEDAFILADAASLIDIPVEVLPGVTDETPPTAPSTLAWLHDGDTTRFDHVDDIATLIDAADYRPHNPHPDQLFG